MSGNNNIYDSVFKNCSFRSNVIVNMLAGAGRKPLFNNCKFDNPVIIKNAKGPLFSEKTNVEISSEITVINSASFNTFGTVYFETPTLCPIPVDCEFDFYYKQGENYVKWDHPVPTKALSEIQEYSVVRMNHLILYLDILPRLVMYHRC